VVELLWLFVGSGWALYCLVVFLLAAGSAALRARRGRHVWLTHLGAALLVSSLYPALWYGYGNASAYLSRQHYARAEEQYAQWKKTLPPPLAPGHVAERLDAMFSSMPSKNTDAWNEIWRRVNAALSTPGAQWTASDLDAFDTVWARLEDNTRGYHIAGNISPSDNWMAAVTAWHRHREDLSGAVAMCGGRGDSYDLACRREMRDAICHWCSAGDCSEYLRMPDFVAAADKIDLHCIAAQ
jgi:hypothetical protein